MEKQNYDVVGVRQKGLIAGYVAKEELSVGAVGASVRHFDLAELVSDSTTLVEVLKMLRVRSRVYVIYLNKVGGIVTKGDLEKAPVRMWLFGLVSLLEIQLLRLIRGFHPDESWKVFLKKSRLARVHKTFEDRKANIEGIDLADCLQFCDKRDILKGSDIIRRHVGIKSKKQVESHLRRAETLRNGLAHAQDIITNSWPNIAGTTAMIESSLEDMEKVEIPV